MSFNPQDPIWSQYVLEPESLTVEERETLEQVCSGNAECQQFVEELRASAGRLRRELSPEMQKVAAPISLVSKEKPVSVPKNQLLGKRGWMLVGVGGLAAVLLLGISVWSTLNSSMNSGRSVATVSEWLKQPSPGVHEGELVESRSETGFLDAASYVDGVRSSEITNLTANDVDAAAIQVELSDFGEKTAPKSDLMASVGAQYGSGLSGRGAAPNKYWSVQPQRSKQVDQFGDSTVFEFESEPTDIARSREKQPENTESYPTFTENPFIKPEGIAALSTFSIDVDTASYSNIRRFLQHATQPPAGAVRLEEMINYFRYDYAPPQDDKPFAVHVESAACPWETKHRLVRVALKGKVIEQHQRPASNLVFLLDVSGSMNEPNKLPLVKRSLQLLVEQLTENDRVAIAVYAGSSGLVLDSTPGNQKQIILNAIDSLQPSGSTNGAAGIKLAYEAAVKGFIPKATNRVILCTDGDFNVGVSSDDELVDLITDRAKTGVFLSVLGFGMGNYKDSKMMHLADKGNGNYAYIDTQREAQKVLVEQMSGTLVTIAKDVKIQVEFNPQKIAAYRLIGYEKRKLAAEDFKDDKKDAGEIGAGHTVTAFYEVVPVGEANPANQIDPLEFQPKAQPKVELPADLANLALRVKLRYKQPDGDTSVEFGVPVADESKPFAAASKDFQFAAAVAAFGRVLRTNERDAKMTLAAVKEIAAAAQGADASGYRAEFLELVEKAKQLPGLQGKE